MWLQLLSLFSLIVTHSSTSAPVFLVQPVSINTIDGSVEVFTCTANGSTLLNYFVDGQSAAFASVQNKGFMEQSTEPLNDDNTLLRRNLTVIASSSLNNNSMIKCQASPSDIDSDEVILRVQGPLSSVVDLSYSFIDSSTVNISWSPPFTLRGTDITGYNISATSNGTTTNYFTSNSYYELSLTDITDSPCNEIIITVTGYNGLDGENTTLTGIYLPSVPSNEIESVSHTLDENIYLSLFINVSGLCVGEYPLVIAVMVTNTTSNASILMQVSPVQVLEVENVTQLQRNTEYTVIVMYSNLAGYFDFNNTLQIYTYDLVSVSVLNSSDSRVCLECSFSSFSTDNAGCTVQY